MSDTRSIPANHYRMALNNYLQERGERRTMNWDVYKTGPDHMLTWHASVYIGGCLCGRFSARTRAAAMEGAARQALSAVQSH
ncbi:hypothetical protein CERSUDRAFT_119107 [Gelatoporia subvermispora B]|uniref:DRBM domain-containing protein n=1 Tax=Ceriporiopsis subvermispora (strain B) TaxID=914234 RepID=M2QJ41_CERS8|nr:hypothetical protein CERSUDRAFT_119107 [Gelatoporia subvermispora B]